MTEYGNCSWPSEALGGYPLFPLAVAVDGALLALLLAFVGVHRGDEDLMWRCTISRTLQEFPFIIAAVVAALLCMYLPCMVAWWETATTATIAGLLVLCAYIQPQRDEWPDRPYSRVERGLQTAHRVLAALLFAAVIAVAIVAHTGDLTHHSWGLSLALAITQGVLGAGVFLTMLLPSPDVMVHPDPRKMWAMEVVAARAPRRHLPYSPQYKALSLAFIVLEWIFVVFFMTAIVAFFKVKG